MNHSGNSSTTTTVRAITIVATQPLCPNDHSNSRAIHSENCFMIRSNHPKNLSKIFLEFNLFSLPNREGRGGISGGAAKRLKRMENMVTPQNCLRRSDTSVLVRAMGRKTITSTNVMEMTVDP